MPFCKSTLRMGSTPAIRRGAFVLTLLTVGSCTGQELSRPEDKTPAWRQDPSLRRTQSTPEDKHVTKPVSRNVAETHARFAIYLVKSPTEERAAEREALKDLVLEEKPILTEEDIDSYRISSNGRHIIRLMPGVKVRVSPLAQDTLLDRGFVVVAGGHRIYLGDFRGMASSWLPAVPCVDLPLSPRGEAAELHTEIEINPSPWMERRGADPRGDPRIRKALRDTRKLDTKPGGDP